MEHFTYGGVPGGVQRTFAEHSAVRDGLTGPACRPCTVAYPCDAVCAARDVIAICEKLVPGSPLSGEALLALVCDLVELGAPGARRVRA